MTLATIVQARTGSTRLPGKVLRKVGGKTVLEHVLHRIDLCAADTGQVVVATTAHGGDNAIAELCKKLGVPCYRGSEHDVLNRYWRTALTLDATEVLRVTADMPLLCPDLTARILEFPGGAADYVTCEHVPLGLAPELVTMDALGHCWREASDVNDREHVTQYMLDRPGEFRLRFLRADSFLFDRRDWRLTLDTPEDLELLERLVVLTGGELFELPTGEIVEAVERSKKARKLATRQA